MARRGRIKRRVPKRKSRRSLWRLSSTLWRYEVTLHPLEAMIDPQEV
jgi:hypothetical protein